MCGRYAVIMAGGKGERFWPLSTSRHPKQLLALVGDKPLIAQAVDRLEGLVPPENVFVVTNKDLVDATRAAAPLLGVRLRHPARAVRWQGVRRAALSASAALWALRLVKALTTRLLARVEPV